MISETIRHSGKQSDLPKKNLKISVKKWTDYDILFSMAPYPARVNAPDTEIVAAPVSGPGAPLATSFGVRFSAMFALLMLAQIFVL